VAARPAQPLSRDAFRQAMRRLAGACCVITSSDGTGAAQGWGGLAATAVCSVSAEPPRLLVCVNRQVFAHRLIVQSGALAVNVLERRQEPIARRFSGSGACAPEDKFRLGRWEAVSTGAPVLNEALAAFDCRVVEVAPGSSHDIFICDVVAVREHGQPQDPLIYFNGEFCGGLSGSQHQPSIS
jgi:flavin reductase (DIM6/NTAB) family NADH-FMN oxidoreductase RutF